MSSPRKNPKRLEREKSKKAKAEMVDKKRSGEAGNLELAIEACPEILMKDIKPFKPLTLKQKDYWKSINVNDITFCTGPQGTGKTYVAGCYAADMIKSAVYERIIITRPAVPNGRDFGALPGTLDEKYHNYVVPFIDVLTERLGKSYFDWLVDPKRRKIHFFPLEFIQGMTFNNTLMILDEAQNATEEQILDFMTRIGENSKIIVDGGLTQIRSKQSGLLDTIKYMQNVNKVGFIEFELEDIVRNGIIKEILTAYAKSKGRFINKDKSETMKLGEDKSG